MVFILVLIVNSMHFIGLRRYDGNMTRIMDCIQLYEIGSALILIETFAGFCIPYVIMVCLDAKVIKRLRQSRQRLGLNSQRQDNQTTDRSVRFTITTVLIDLIYFVFNFPITLTNAYFAATLLFTNIKRNTISETLDHFSHLLSLSYSAVLFFLFLIFNRIFRKEFIDVFRLGKLAKILPFRGLSFNFFFSTNNSENHNQH